MRVPNLGIVEGVELLAELLRRVSDEPGDLEVWEVGLVQAGGGDGCHRPLCEEPKGWGT